MVRCFISVDIPKEKQEKLFEIKKDLEKFCFSKFVKRENLHITLKFLGDINDDEIKTVKEKLHSISKIKSFNVSLSGIGAFPNDKNPRIIWVGIEEGLEELILIRNEIDNKILLGEKDSRPFSPHVTICRVKRIFKRDRLEKFLKEKINFNFGNFLVNKINLKRSVLARNGPIYSDIEVFYLND